MAEKTLKKVSDIIPEGTIPINETIGLTKILNLNVTKTKKKYNSKDNIYFIDVSVSHPTYGNMSFSFDYVPSIKKPYNKFCNVNGDNICVGTTPHGEIKDVILAAITDESYAYQLSNKRTTWCHAERDPNQGEYLLWHYLYYGKYSPRSDWRLPDRCAKEKLYTQYKCNICNGQKCDYIKKKCQVCGKNTLRQCPKCSSPVCQNHSHCNNGHLNLTENGMYQGSCVICGRKTPIEDNVCICGSKKFSRF